MKDKQTRLDCCDWRTKDECPRHKQKEHFWTGYVCVSKAFPDVRYSEVYDIRSHCVDKAKKTKGLKVIKVKIIKA